MVNRKWLPNKMDDLIKIQTNKEKVVKILYSLNIQLLFGKTKPQIDTYILTCRDF